MTGYLVNFSLYTLGMIGVILMALFAFKVFSNKCLTKKSAMLNIEDSMALSQRKTLYVINAGAERFLIAADTERTTLISKLNDKSETFEKGIKLVKNEKEERTERAEREDKSTKLSSFDGVESINEFSSFMDFQQKKSTKKPMMRELANKLSVI